MIGKEKSFFLLRPSSVVKTIVEGQRTKDKGQKGFSLLELMIGMFIIIILLSVALPTYQRSVLYARERVLEENLWQMRRQIDQFAADKGKLPESLQKLVDDKYLQEIPLDPTTEKREWEETLGEDPNSSDGAQGLTNVRSKSDELDSSGQKKYSEY